MAGARRHCRAGGHLVCSIIQGQAESGTARAGARGPGHNADHLNLCSMPGKIARREWAKSLLLTGVALAAKPAISLAGYNDTSTPGKMKGNINHAVCFWTYNFLPLEELCAPIKKIGCAAIDLVGPKDWNILKKYGVYSSMCNGAEISLTEGWNHEAYHATLIKNYTEHINLVADAGYK